MNTDSTNSVKTRYERVIEILDESIGGPHKNIGAHGAFWRGKTRDQFISMKVFGHDLLVLGNGQDSNLVRSLTGVGLFGVDQPNAATGAQFSRMPAGGPFVSDSDIAFISKWIDDGCPEDLFVQSNSSEQSTVTEQSNATEQSEGNAIAPAQPQWRATNAPVASSRTDDIYFLDENTGWAVNSNGQIIHTTDGGNSWAEQLHDPEVYFRCVGMASALRGWAGSLTTPKRLFETSDGGKNWTLVANLPPLAPSFVCGMSVVNENVVYVSGTNSPTRAPRIMKTLDGGKTWIAKEMRPWADILIDCHFTSEKEGWVVGGKASHPTTKRDDLKPVVLFTADGGETWENRVKDVDFPLGEWGWKIQLLNDQVIFVSLENENAGAILKSTDGGKTFTRLVITDPQGNANLEGIGFLDSNHGWVGGWGDDSFTKLTSSETLDGGMTWRDANEIGKGINRFRFFGNPVSLGYASGVTVYKYSIDPVSVPAPKTVTSALLLDDHKPLTLTGSDSAQLNISIPEGSKSLAIRVWDRFGNHVRTIADEATPHGQRSVVWDRTDDQGNQVAPGHFICRVTVDQKSESRLLHIK